MPKGPSVKNKSSGASQGPQLNGKIYPKAVLVIAVACILALVYLWFVPGSIPIRFALAIVILLIGSELLVIKGGSARVILGVNMLSTKDGIDIVEKVANGPKRFWIALADWGLVMGFGLMSYFIFKKQINKKTIVIGLISLALFYGYIIDYTSVLLNFITLPQVSNAISTQIQQLPSGGLTQSEMIYNYLKLIAVIIFGSLLYAVLIFAYLIYNAAIILIGLPHYLSNVASGTPGVISQAVPYAALPALPGITIPLFSGIFALIVLLTIHEMSHGILLKIADTKLKLKSVGLILIGIIPMGAFVEPDEKQVVKLKRVDQIRVFIAGIASNFLLSFIFFAFFLIMLTYIIPNIMSTHVIVAGVSSTSHAYNIIQPGDIIQSWNGYPIQNITSFKQAAVGDTPRTNVSIVTNMSSYVFMTNGTGKVGISVLQTSVLAYNTFPYQFAEFLYQFVALSFVFNFAVAIFNILPIIFLDGFRLFDATFSNKTLTKVLVWLSWVFVVVFLINMIPLFTLI